MIETTDVTYTGNLTADKVKLFEKPPQYASVAP